MPNVEKIALITGASSGIGAALSRNLCEKGYRCILAARSSDKLEKLAQSLRNDGFNCSVVIVDVSSESSVDALFEASAKIGHVSLVINNAGLGIFSKIEESSVDDWDAQINVNLRGAFLVSRKFIPSMQSQKSGILVFMNSVAGNFGYPYSAAYVASKFGLRGLSDSLRNELRKDSIKVISVHPGAINTSFWDDINVDFPREEMLAPEAIASSVVHAIDAPDATVIENLTIRRVGGDF
ncbi:MAG: SDR family oxidoreductase [Candidatus Marinimicrobia bacterium]|jgi:NADP-dependent 3-hydroxy acid dehydrogenase YdfG|nr:SDR family oxidoreductase [Candidatus Neomarinimicrobiota bacterium]|tara:strand:- start:1849 stop:2562 length:714 start_codon:yes stop_codon:yes gene_type:complete